VLDMTAAAMPPVRNPPSIVMRARCRRRRFGRVDVLGLARVRS
jgi:hypothetical protein